MIQHMISGGLAGLAATLPMTIFMESAFRELPCHEQYALPPREITDELTSKAGVRQSVDEHDLETAAMAAHFAYGTAVGALFAPLVQNTSLPRVTTGIGFGLAVWAGSYLGLLPATNILTPATEHPPRRNALMIGAHVVWGAALGKLVGLLSPQTY